MKRLLILSMPALRNLCLAWILLLEPCPLPASEKNPPYVKETVLLQLKWYHQFQFAGYYAAKHKGYYEEEGLDVLISEGGEGKSAIPLVANGIAQYGVTDSDVVMARMQGKPLVALAAIFQHSPYIFISKKEKGIRTPADLVNKRVMLSDDQGAAQLKAVLIKEGIDPDLVRLVPHSWNLRDLIDGNVDAITAYAMVEPNQLKAAGVEHSILRSIDYGIDFYGDILFTSEKEIQDHPERAEAFLRASLKGWDYALKNPGEISDLILGMKGAGERGLSKELLLQEAEGMKPYILSQIVALGHMNPGRWQEIANTFAGLGMAPKDFSLEGFTYEPERQKQKRLFQTLSWILGVLALITLLIVLWNRQIRRQVLRQTREIQNAEERYIRQRNAIIQLMQAQPPEEESLLHSFRKITEICAEALEVSRTSIWRFKEDRKTGICVDLYEKKLGLHSSGAEVDTSLFPQYCRALQESDLIAVEDGPKDSITSEMAEVYYKPFGIRGVMDAPIRLGGALDGVISFEQTDTPRAWTSDEKTFAIAMANFVILSIERWERRQAENIIIENQRVLSTLLGNLSGMAYRSRPGKNWHMDYVSEGCRELTGYTVEELTDSSLPGYTALIAPDEVKKLRWEVDTSLLKKKPYDLTYSIKTKNGDIKWIWERGVGIWDKTGQLTSLEGFITDITDKHNAYERIKEQADLLDKARDAICVEDQKLGITFWNKGAARLYGWPASEALGRRLHDILKTDPEKAEEISTHLQENENWTGEVQKISRDGTTLIINSSVTLLRDDSHQPQSILTIDTDVTEKKILERQFLRAQRMESIGTLAGGIAHDLNNVLTPIIMASDLLENALQEEKNLLLIANIKKSAQRGSEMVRQVLSFARGVEGRRIPVLLTDLVRDLEKIIRDTFPKNIRIQVDAPAAQETLLGDPTQLHQVLINLCVNARDAMPQGGLLNVKTEKVELDSQYAAMNLDARAGHYIMITVQDNGSGISPQIMDKIFDPFYTSKTHGQGTGLGLSTSQAIVKSHGGFIRVSSQPGSGSIFRVYLPLGKSAPILPETREEPQLPRGNGETILLVDDEISIRQVTQQTLEAFGYKILTAGDGAEAVAIYARQRHEIDLVLTDIMMPVMDGITCIQVLLKMNPKVLIIAASGVNSNSGSSAKLLEAGVKEFLPKPYTANKLLNALKRVLSS